MALVLADRVQETTTSTGTGTITLAGAASGYQSFSTAIGNGNTTYYTISGGSEWEVGIGTYTSAGNTLSRDTVLSSSAGGTTKVTFSAGTKNVFVTYPAEKSVNEDASGNVGIGTSSPGYKLDVTGSARVTSTLGVGGAPNSYGVVQVAGDSTDIYSSQVSIRGTTDRNKLLLVGVNTTGNYGSIQAFQDGTGTLPLALNPSGGNVGIGGTPSTKLDVAATGGMMRVGGASGNNLVQAYTGSVGLGLWAGGSSRIYSGGGITFSINGTLGTSAPTGYTDAAVLTGEGRFLIGTTTGVGNDFTSIRFNSSTTYSQGLNMVDSNASANGAYYQVFRKSDDTNIGLIRRSGTDNAIFVGGNSYLALGSGDTERARIDSSGNVGIGTSSPGAKLDVAGGDIYVRTGGRVLTDTVQGYSGLTTPLALSAAQTVTISTASTERMRIDSSGNVGIGTSSPGAKLNVYGGYLLVQGGASSAQGVFSTTASTVDVEAIGANAVRINTNGSERMRIDSSGNVGIGTTSPNSRLDSASSASGTIATSIRATNSAAAFGTPGQGVQIGFANDSGWGANLAGAVRSQITNTTTGASALSFHTWNGTALTEYLRIASNGAIGLSGANYGTSGQVLTSNGSGSAPTWQTPAMTQARATALSMILGF